MQGYAHVLSIRRKKPSHDQAVPNSGLEKGDTANGNTNYGCRAFPKETQSESNIQVGTGNLAGSSRSSSYPNSSSSGSYSSSIQAPVRTVSDQYGQPSYTPYLSPNGPDASAEYAEPQTFEDSSGYYGQEVRSAADPVPITNRDSTRDRMLSRSMNWRRPTDPRVQVQQTQGSREKGTRDSCVVDDQTSSRHMEVADGRRQTLGYLGSAVRNDWVASRDNPDQGVACSDWDFPQEAQTTAPHRHSVQQIVSPRDSRFINELERLWDDGGAGWHGNQVRDDMTNKSRDERYCQDPVDFQEGQVEEYEDPRPRNLPGLDESDEDDPSSESARAFLWDVYVRWDDPNSNRASFITESCTLLLDSGCEKSNWVAERIVKRLRAQTYPVSHIANFLGFNGQPMFSSSQTILAFQHKNGGEAQRAVFFVASGEGLPFEMVLGVTDCLKFGYLTKPKPPAFCGGLAAPKMSKAEKKEQEERDALQAQKKKDQRDKHRQLTRKKVSSEVQNQNQNKESSGRRPTG
ncbi:hypothetical protein BDZ45DRAFT_681745 [Acephala macrosclerotiorum]|nr:hypothetical protein BDZ45DRAFT_681745 [Acephala macrosclerotiorum]